MHHHGSRDGNHEEIKAAFLALGCTVADTALAGIPGFPDLVVGCIGVNHLVEIKNTATGYGKRGLSKGQIDFNDAWRGECAALVHTADDAASLVGMWRIRK
jgi:hypothetical protein